VLLLAAALLGLLFVAVFLVDIILAIIVVKEISKL